MTTFDSVKKRFSEFNRQYSRYYSYRQLSFILFSLASLLGYDGLYNHIPVATVLCTMVYGSSVFLFIEAQKRLNSILNDLLLEQTPVSMSIQEEIKYLEMKITLTDKLVRATPSLLLMGGNYYRSDIPVSNRNGRYAGAGS